MDRTHPCLTSCFMGKYVDVIVPYLTNDAGSTQKFVIIWMSFSSFTQNFNQLLRKIEAQATDIIKFYFTAPFTRLTLSQTAHYYKLGKTEAGTVTMNSFIQMLTDSIDYSI